MSLPGKWPRKPETKGCFFYSGQGGAIAFFPFGQTMGVMGCSESLLPRQEIGSGHFTI
jgi:hypothetical protein